jgi:hypothetical protein
MSGTADAKADLQRKCQDLEALEKEGELAKAELTRRATDPTLPHDQRSAAREALKEPEASNSSALAAFETSPESWTPFTRTQ